MISHKEFFILARKGKINPRLFVEQHLAELNSSPLNAFTDIIPEAKYIRKITQSVERLKNNSFLPLDGMLITAKDNIAVKEFKLSCASSMLKEYISVYDAEIIEMIKNTGGIIIGKTNLDEFAMSSAGLNS